MKNLGKEGKKACGGRRFSDERYLPQLLHYFHDGSEGGGMGIGKSWQRKDAEPKESRKLVNTETHSFVTFSHFGPSANQNAGGGGQRQRS
jgi:hypothetical protein